MTEGKKYTAAAAKIDRTKLYDVQQAVALVRSAAYAKFNETLEVAMRLGVDPKHADQMVRGTVVLPHGTGQTIRVAVVASGEKVREAEDAGAEDRKPVEPIGQHQQQQQAEPELRHRHQQEDCQ